MSVSQTISDAGGITAVARILGVPRTTVQYWAEQDRVPRWRLADLERLALAVRLQREAAPKKRRAA
jgi:DNA-binding transcriptional MerR regulator